MSRIPIAMKPDTLDDAVGRCLQRLHAIPRWNLAKRQAFNELLDLLKAEGYAELVVDARTVPLLRVGQSGLSLVPPTKAKQLAWLVGKPCRFVCTAYLDAYSKRAVMVKEIALAVLGLEQ